VRSPRVSRALASLFYRIRRAHRSTLFPYTTLFRSLNYDFADPGSVLIWGWSCESAEIGYNRARWCSKEFDNAIYAAKRMADPVRSEEHTSELQSRENLVCRLLLEKKNKQRVPLHHS